MKGVKNIYIQPLDHKHVINKGHTILDLTQSKKERCEKETLSQHSWNSLPQKKCAN